MPAAARASALALTLALTPGCTPDTDSSGGKPTLGGSTRGGTEADSGGSIDDTGEPIPEGPRRRRLDLAIDFVGVPSSTLLVVLDPTRIEYDDTQPDGSDLRFFGPDGTTPYPAEIERWQDGGTSLVWVRVTEPSLPTHLWMHYADGEGFPPADHADVWGGAFDAVWHMAVQGTAFPDSSGSGNPLVAVDFVGELEAEGALGPAATLNDEAGDSGPLEVSEVGDLTLGDAFTLEAWVSRPTDGEGHDFIALADGSVELRARDPALSVPSITVRTVGVGSQRVQASGTLDAAWTYLVATYRASDGMLVVYRNGQPEMSLMAPGDPQTRAPLPPAGVLRIGVGLVGSIDEVRVSSIARSPSWVALQHASMSDALLTFGPPIER